VQAGAIPLALATLCVYLFATVFVALAAFSDPGTIAPNRDPDIRRAVQLSAPVEVTIRGVRLQLKHCATCGIHRPPRAVHCRETNRCVRKWDHYCPWIGNSVGEANYPYFLLFVASALALSVLVATGSALHIRHLATASVTHAGSGAGLAGATWTEIGTAGLAVAGRDAVAASRPSVSPSIGAWLVAVAQSPLSCALLALCTVSTTLLTLLLAYHAYLISTNQTTYENVSRHGRPLLLGHWRAISASRCPYGEAGHGRLLTPSRTPTHTSLSAILLPCPRLVQHRVRCPLFASAGAWGVGVPTEPVRRRLHLELGAAAVLFLAPRRRCGAEQAGSARPRCGRRGRR
jgi:hypothetical protein